MLVTQDVGSMKVHPHQIMMYVCILKVLAGNNSC